MEDLKNKTQIELQKLFNDIREKHDLTKETIMEITYQIDDLSMILNGKIELLSQLETDYVLLAEEIDRR